MNDRALGILCGYLDKTGKEIDHIFHDIQLIYMQ